MHDLYGKKTTGYGCLLFDMKVAEMLILTRSWPFGSMGIVYIMAYYITIWLFDQYFFPVDMIRCMNGKIINALRQGR